MLPLLAFAAALVAALVLVEGQPVRSPWWTYADADATYSASSLNLLLGNPVRYQDHPGLPLQELGMFAFALDYLLEGGGSRLEYVDRMMLNLDEARPIFRGLAIAIYVISAALAFWLLARLFGHWTWGLAGSLLWLAAPGLAAMSIQFRPDVLLGTLAIVFAFFVARAAELRSPQHYFAATAVFGFAVMVKMHAAGLVAALVVAALWRPPPANSVEQVWRRAIGWANARRGRLVAFGVAVGSLAVVTNSARAPFELTAEQRRTGLVVVTLLVLVVGAALLAHRRAAPAIVRQTVDFGALLFCGLLAGVAVPVLFDLPDGLQSLVNIRYGLTGRGVNEGVDPFSVDLDALLSPELRIQFVTFVVAGIAAALGVLRREPPPVIWFAGASAVGLMAAARLGTLHYFAPAYVMSIPGALWALSRGGTRQAPLLVWPVVLFAVWPQFDDRTAATAEQERLAAAAAPTLDVLARRLQPNEVALTPSYWPHPDPRFFDVVRQYVQHTPDYPYRFLPANAPAARFADERGLRLRYFTSPTVFHLTGTQQLEIPDVGSFTVRRMTDAPLAVELLEGPGTSPAG